MPAKYIGRIVEIIYQDRAGKLSQRRIRVQDVDDGKVRAIDLVKNAPRVFDVDRILSALPVVGRAI